MEVDTVTLPAYWASAIVNGDYSGLDTAEGGRCSRALAALAREGWRVVDVARGDDGDSREPRFTWHYQLYDIEADYSGGEVLDYTMTRNEGSK